MKNRKSSTDLMPPMAQHERWRVNEPEAVAMVDETQDTITCPRCGRSIPKVKEASSDRFAVYACWQSTRQCGMLTVVPAGDGRSMVSHWRVTIHQDHDAPQFNFFYSSPYADTETNEEQLEFALDTLFGARGESVVPAAALARLAEQRFGMDRPTRRESR